MGKKEYLQLTGIIALSILLFAPAPFDWCHPPRFQAPYRMDWRGIYDCQLLEGGEWIAVGRTSKTVYRGTWRVDQESRMLIINERRIADQDGGEGVPMIAFLELTRDLKHCKDPAIKLHR